MSPLDHIFLYLLLFGLFLLFQKKVVYIKNDFYTKALIPIMAFTIIEGCRYARGTDYLHYKAIYDGTVKSDESQLFYNWFTEIIKYLGIDFVGFVILAAFIFIFGVFFFIKNTYEDKGKFMYLFAVLAMLLNFECFIRQYFAMPFLLVGLSLFIKGGKRNMIKAIFIIFPIVFIHTGLLFCIPFIVISFFYVKKVIPLMVSLSILFAAYYLIPTGFFSGTFIENLNIIYRVIGGGDYHMAHYVENSDRWLGTDSILAEAAQSPITKTLQFFFECSVLILGYYTLKIIPNKNILFLYNITFAGFVFCRIFHGYEIFTRLFGQFYIFWFVPVGYSFYILYRLKAKKRLYLNYLSFLLIIYLLTYWGRFVFLNPEADYIWNH